MEPRILSRTDFGELFRVLRDRGFQVVGPTVADGAIVYDQLESVDDLPIGWTDQQEAGRYRLLRRGDEALFGYVVGPQSWKKYLHPPHVKLFGSHRESGGKLVFDPAEEEEPPRYAFLGIRSCELHAIAIQDRVFLGSGFTDAIYEKRRKGIFTVAVNCGVAGGTCFCVSMNTGPNVKAESQHDLALTEILEPVHHFVLTAGSQVGREVLAELPTRPAHPEEIQSARALVAKTAEQMGRRMDASDVKTLLYQNLEHGRWDDLAERCLSCANCTMVCPTCFCTTVEDVTDLTGENAERWRRWDSCFTMDFSYIHGGGVRQSAKSRYRQWLTHKLATWHDQFGSSGCVGCGRCISWCPVGIDITEEIAAIRSTSNQSNPPTNTDGNE